MPVTEEQIATALRHVHDPDLHKDIVALGHVKSVKVLEGNISIELSTPSPAKEQLRQSIHAALSHLDGVEEVFVNFTVPLAATGPVNPAARKPAPPPQPQGPRGIPGVAHIIAVGAGKGGVGKSTVAVNLAIALALSGKKVAILDGDIYGPSIPTLTGIPPQPPQIIGDRIVPFTITNPADPRMTLRVMSIGFMVDKEKALIWRGPMAHGAMKQMIEQVEWTAGEMTKDERQKSNDALIDYLIVDLPPGTGDVSLTLAQTVPLTGAVIVATPQEVALADARRAVRMFQQLGVEILGVVENMSHFVCEHGTSYDIFGRGGAKVMAEQMGLPFLGELPIDTAMRKASDAGTPFANFSLASPSRKPLMALAEMLDKQVAVRMATRPAAKAPRLDIS